MGYKEILRDTDQDKDDWATPQHIFDELDREFHFTLDPCATDKNHKCAKYYTKEQDGLKQSWDYETVFCNPPYGRETEKWIKKAYYTHTHTAVVMLLPSRTDTKWFHNYIYGKAEIRFIKGRLKFGKAKHAAPFGSIVVIWRGER